jgi:hypothetical protein
VLRSAGGMTVGPRLVPLSSLLFLLAPALLLPAAVRATGRTQITEGRVSISADAEPLADVLTRFAQATGAELVYEASRPRQLVSVGIEADSQAEALSRLLEGQGLNYALRLAPNGRDIQLLVIGASSSTPAPMAASGGRSGRPQPGLEQDFSAPEVDEAEPIIEEQPEPEPAPAAAPEGSPQQQTGFVTPGAPAIGMDGRGNSPMPYQPNPGGSMTPGPGPFQSPQLPQPASYPGPMAPRFPQPVSFPGANGS